MKRLALYFLVAALFAVHFAVAQKPTAQQPTLRRKRADPALPVLERAKNELAAGNKEAARKSFEQAFRLDKRHLHNEISTALAGMFLDEQVTKGQKYDLTRDQLAQRFEEVPYLAQGFCDYHLGDKDDATHAWHKIIEWRSSDDLVQYLHEFKLEDEVQRLKSEMGIDSGTGSAARKALEDKYTQESKWEGAFQLARKRLVEIPVAAKGEQAAQFEKLAATCLDYFSKQSDPQAALRKMADDLAQKTREHQRVLEQILSTRQVSRTSLAKVRQAAEAEKILSGRVQALEETAAYLEELAGGAETPVAADPVAEPESPPAP